MTFCYFIDEGFWISPSIAKYLSFLRISSCIGRFWYFLVDGVVWRFEFYLFMLEYEIGLRGCSIGPFQDVLLDPWILRSFKIKVFLTHFQLLFPFPQPCFIKTFNGHRSESPLKKTQKFNHFINIFFSKFLKNIVAIISKSFHY